MKAVLVSGATGFLGRHVVTHLCRQGVQVGALGRNVQVGRALQSLPTCRFFHCDIRDKTHLHQIQGPYDAAVHCAALSSLWGAYETFYEANVKGTQHVIELALSCNVKKFIHISSPSIYYCSGKTASISETDPLPNRFINHYAQTKWMGEQKVNKAFRTCGLPAVILRPKGIFGPGDTGIMPRILRARRGSRMILINNGEAKIDMTYVDNVVDAIVGAMECKEDVLGETYNITNDEPLTVKQLLSHVFKCLDMPVSFVKVPRYVAYAGACVNELYGWMFGSEPVYTRYGIQAISQSQTLNIEKSKKQLRYLPKVAVEEGVKRYARWYKANHS